MEKLEWCGRPWWRKFEDMITRFETIYINVINSTTDGQTDTAWRAKIYDIWNESYEFNSIYIHTYVLYYNDDRPHQNTRVIW